jgi:tyrosyl-tRNA synthetase
MGKTERGTVWLDRKLTSPYDYYQYWVNVDDADVERFLALFTLLPMEEVRQARTLSGVELNMGKSVLAFEATKITHGEAEAVDAWRAAVRAFNVKPVDAGLFPSCTIPRAESPEGRSAMPSLTKAHQELEKGIPAFELFTQAGLCASRGEARRLIAQGGGYVNDVQLKAFDEIINANHLDAGGEIRLRKGKKHHFIVRVK